MRRDVGPPSSSPSSDSRSPTPTKGQGYGTSARTAVVAEAHRAGFPVVWATVRPHNHASLTALAGFGFQRHHIENDGKGRLIYLLHQ